MSSSPMGSTRGRTTSGVTCRLLPWKEYMVGGRRGCYAILSLVQHTRSEDAMPSWPLDRTHCHTTSGMAGHHCLSAAYTGSDDVEHGMLLSLLDIIHCRVMSSMERYHRSQTANKFVHYRTLQWYNLPSIAQMIGQWLMFACHARHHPTLCVVQGQRWHVMLDVVRARVLPYCEYGMPRTMSYGLVCCLMAMMA